jgi:hypothetical protein
MRGTRQCFEHALVRRHLNLYLLLLLLHVSLSPPVLE